MKEIFQGNISKETADTLVKLSTGGGSSGLITGYTDIMLNSYDLLTDRDISSYLPESTTESIPAGDFTDSLCKALADAVNDGVNFYTWDRAVVRVTLQNIYSEEDPTKIISLAIYYEGLDEPEYWSADDGSNYSANCYTFTNDPPVHTYFNWYTEEAL